MLLDDKGYQSNVVNAYKYMHELMRCTDQVECTWGQSFGQPKV